MDKKVFRLFKVPFIILTSGMLLFAAAFFAARELSGGFIYLFFLPGIFVFLAGYFHLIFYFIRILKPGDEYRVVSILKDSKELKNAPRVVVIGGGTGLSVLLRGLKKLTDNITAIVTVTDDGASSGRLVRDFDILPPGDIRNCLVSLASAEPLMTELFQYRFGGSGDLGGHNFGNLFITALKGLTGDFERAIIESSRVLAIKGKVLPASLSPVTLGAVFEDGGTLGGESAITASGRKIKRVFLTPGDAGTTKNVIESIEKSDIIILGPGSLYTSIIPNLLINDLRRAVKSSSSRKVYICNVMTQRGETGGYKLSDHVRAVYEHCGPGVIDFVLVYTGLADAGLAEKYRLEGSEQVVLDIEKIREFGVKIIPGRILSADGFLRHDPDKLAAAIRDNFFYAKEDNFDRHNCSMS